MQTTGPESDLVRWFIIKIRILLDFQGIEMYNYFHSIPVWNESLMASKNFWLPWNSHKIEKKNSKFMKTHLKILDDMKKNKNRKKTKTPEIAIDNYCIERMG